MLSYRYAAATIIVAVFCISTTQTTLAQTVSTPSVPQPSSSQLVGANFQNPTAQAVAAGPVQFGQAFASGDLASGSGISATVNGVSSAAQIDVKTSYGNGSVKFGVITVMAPSLSANSVNPTMISPAVDSGSDISLSSLPGYSFIITMAVSGSTTYTFNVGNLFAQELSAGRVSYWRRGPVVTEGRIEIPIASSMRLVVDLAKYQNGSYSTDVQFNNDRAMTSQGGQVDYSITVVQNGQTVASYPNLQHQQYQQWRQLFWTSATPVVNVQRDVAYLKEVGVIHQYDLGVGVATSLISNMQSFISGEANWGKPFDGAGITKYMGGTGGRPDIGPATGWNAAWIKSQDATAAIFALGQAQAAAGIPWHFWDVGNATWLNNTNYPNLWTDYRGGTGTPGDSSSSGLTQQVDASLYDWQPDSAHIPALSYTPYLFTGVRFYLDQLNAEATYVEMSFWPTGPEYGNARNFGEGLVLSLGNQVRGGAWSFRELVSAAWANPDGTVEKTYFTDMVENNLDYVNRERAARIISQGQIYGYNTGAYGYADVLPPWQQDYLMTSMALASQLGFSGADTYINWATNWSAGRFLNAANGFNPRDGVNYAMVMQPDGLPLAQTWAKLAEYTAVRTNGNGWIQSQGDYGQLGLAALASIINRTGSQQAIDAYAILRALDPPYTSTSSYEGEPAFNIVPNIFVAATTTPPATAPTATLTAGSVALTVGQSTVLTWSSTNATTCTGTNFTTGATAGTRTVSPTATTTYTVSCVGTGGSTSANVVVGVSAVVSTSTGTTTPSVDTPPASGSSSGGGGGGGGGSRTITTSSANSGAQASRDGSAIAAGTAVTLATKDGTWQFSTKKDSGGYEIMRNGKIVTSRGAVKMVVSNNGKIYAINNKGTVVNWSNGRFVSVSKIIAENIVSLPTTAPTPVVTGNFGSGGSSSAVNPSIGIGSRIKALANVNVRALPALTGVLRGVQLLGKQGTVLSGPVTASGYTWWNVDYDNSILDGFSVATYLAPAAVGSAVVPPSIPTLLPGRAPATVKPSTGSVIKIGNRIRTTTTVNVRATASTAGAVKGRQVQGALGSVVGGPITAAGYTWWVVNFDGSIINGWVVADYLSVEAVSQVPGLPAVLGESTSRSATQSGGASRTIIGVTPLQKFANQKLITEFLSLGSTGEEVKQLQMAMRSFGYLEAAVTGYYGKQTERAVMAFQIARGLEATGTVGQETQDVLNWR